MEKILHSSELFSHPGRLLEEHLIGTARFADYFFNDKPVSIRKDLQDVGKIIALCHDLGKSTNFFQQYLISPENKSLNHIPTKKTQHSLFSAIPTYFICKEIFGGGLLPYFAYIVVRRHHGNLISIADEVTLYDYNDCRFLLSLFENIDQNKFSILADKLYDAGLPFLITLENIENWICEFNNEIKNIKKLIRQSNNNINNYLNLNLLYSILLDADKSDAVLGDINYINQRCTLSSNLVDVFKSKTSFRESSINHLRERAYKEIFHKTVKLDQKIYSINLPTGLGKTLIAFSFALKLRDSLGSKHRIIYSLPFLSIIDQNSQVFESVLKENDIIPGSNILLKHHHISDLYYKTSDDTEFESDEARILIEGWNAEIIVTTFMQLFYALISNKNRNLRKFHKLANSIIILDEIQTIPIKYWSLLRNLFLELVNRFSAYIILVTATEPMIFEKDELTCLINKEEYFNKINRATIKPLIKQDITLEELTDTINIKEHKSYLFILNTISAAKSLFSIISQKGLKVAFLSTHIIPKERLKRIKQIMDKNYRIVVSTQLVEAGVDIDFDVVVRDFAPFDSIIQAAGRCNRNNNLKGEVYVASLKDSNNKLYSSYIYDPVLIEITRKILNNYDEIKEKDLLQLTQQYYQEVNRKKSQDISSAILNSIKELKYDSCDDKDKLSISDFKLIEEDFPKMDVFIEIDDEATAIWKKYLDLKYITDLFERKKYFDSLKPSFYQHVISIPKNVPNRPDFIGELGYVAKSRLNEYYNLQTGYVLQEDKTIIIC
ncbi:MAG: CRISPR-associated helicase Cas3' [Candidatus Aminicenantes bacterium]|nr:CRISPR-associated helicase Cas3' [Candidatus Aminicenantes bacterium]